jgi:hypothetical protein
MPINDIDLKRTTTTLNEANANICSVGNTRQATLVRRKAARGNPIEFICKRADLRLCLQLRPADGMRWYCVHTMDCSARARSRAGLHQMLE